MSCADRPAVAAALAVLSLATGTAVAAADLATLVVVPERGQSADQARRDRYECHNWAVEQTGSAPLRAEPDADRRDRRARRVDKVLLGAAIGAAVGGIVRGSESRRSHDEAADGALGGAVLGAAAGAVAGRRDDREAAGEVGPDSDYLRALGACLEGRGYSLGDGDTG